MRAAAQRLTLDTAAKSRRPAAILRQVVGLQAQVPDAAALGMRVRSTDLRASDVNRALVDDRSIVRTWLMRGTLHLVAADDIRWLVQLLGPVFARAGATRHAQLGLDDDLKARGVAALRRILIDAGPLTRYELVDRLRGKGIALDPKTQAPIHLIGLAAMQAVLCVGPDRDDGESTYVLLDDWVPPARTPTREAALAELARRYFAGYGPATIDDLSAWSGLAMAEARSAVAGAKPSLAEVTIQGQPGCVLKDRLRQVTAIAAPQARLLPAFDAYLLGYRRRDLAVAPALQRRLQRGGGWLHPAVVVNGRAVATWSLRKSGGRGRLQVEPFEGISRTIRAGIEAEVADIGRFLDLPVTLEIAR
jgi:Winged helix DNA-binding domain